MIDGAADSRLSSDGTMLASSGPAAVFKELWRGRPQHLVLYQKIIGERRMQWAFVRTEGKLVVSMLKGLARLLADECHDDQRTAGSSSRPFHQQ